MPVETIVIPKLSSKEMAFLSKTAINSMERTHVFWGTQLLWNGDLLLFLSEKEMKTEEADEHGTTSDSGDLRPHDRADGGAD